MRAKEFIPEGENPKISKRNQSATKGLHLFRDGERWNTEYTLNRIMMAVAGTDGKTMPDLDKKSWIGKFKSSHPYTKEEADMLKLAYKIVGADYEDINNGDLESEELKSTNTLSTLKPFKGYKKK
jgi:hypothetical protein